MWMKMQGETDSIPAQCDGPVPDSNENFMDVLNTLVNQEGGLRSFCQKHSLPFAAVNLVVSGVRPLTHAFVEKILAIEAIPVSVFEKIVPGDLSAASKVVNTFDEKVHQVLNDSDQVLTKARTRKIKARRDEKNPSLMVDVLLERHRNKILREEALLAAAIRKAEAEEEVAKLRDFARMLSKAIVEKTRFGYLIREDLNRIEQIIHGKN
jgi:hypothetical protein